MIDVVIPKGNEKEFIKMAKRLGLTRLIFLYPLKGYKKFESKELQIYSGILAKHKEVNKAHQKSEIVFVESSDNDRFVIEKLKTDVMFDLERQMKKDLMFSRRSGLNQVLCKLMNKKKKILGLNFNFVLNAGRKRSRLIGRMMQNVRFARKFKMDATVFSFAREPYEMRSFSELESFGIILMMHPKEAKQALNSLYDRVIFNKRKKAKEIIKEGLEIIS